MNLTKREKELILYALNEIPEYTTEIDELWDKIKKYNGNKLEILFSEEDLHDLMRGREFNWVYGATEVKLKMGEE